MTTPTEQLVRFVLADHLEVDPKQILPEQRLELDLGLTPLAVILIVLDVEDLVDSFVPFERLMKVKTVADLAALFEGRELRTKGRTGDAALRL